MKLKSLFHRNNLFSRKNKFYVPKDSNVLKRGYNVNVSKALQIPSQNYLLKAGIFAATAGTLFFLSKSKTKDSLDLEDLMTAINNLQAGDVDSFVVTLATLSKNNNELKEIITSFESDNFYHADQLAKSLLVNKLAQKEMYYFVKGIILSAYAEVQFESDSLARSNKDIREISPWYFDAVNCFREVMQSDKNKELQLLALTHHNRLINRLKCRYSKAAISSMEKKMAYNQPLRAKILIWLQWAGIEKSGVRDESQPQSNFDAVYSKLKPIIKQYWPLTDNSKFQNKNRVTVRIWDRKNESEVGHVSLETPQYYISHWNEVKLGDRTFLEDVIAYQRLPDTRISLYTLDVEKIHVTYNNFRQSNCQWDLLGSTVLSSMSQKNSQNCSGLTAVLLKVGGVEKLASLYWHPFKDVLKDSAILGGAIIWTMISIAGIAGKVECDVINFKQSAAEVERLMKEAIERQKQLTLSKDIFFLLTGLFAVGGGLFSAYNLICNDIPRLLGYGLVTHPEHIKVLIENAKKFEIENIQSDLHVISNKM